MLQFFTMNLLTHYFQQPLYLTELWQRRLSWYGLVWVFAILSTLLIHLFLPAELVWQQLLVHAAQEGFGYCLAFALVDSLMHGPHPNFKQLTVGRAWLLLVLGSQVGFIALYIVGSALPWFMPRPENRAGLSSLDIYWRLLPINLVVVALWIEHLRQVTVWRAISLQDLAGVEPGSDAAARPEVSSTLLLPGIASTLSLADIVAIQADENYCHFFLKNGQREMLRTTMKEVVAAHPLAFLQVHRSWCVNRDYVNVLNRSGRQGFLRLQHLSQAVPVSRSKLAEVTAQLAAR